MFFLSHLPTPTRSDPPYLQTEASISFLRPPICHKPPTSNLYNPETAPHLPWVSSSPWPQITHHTHHAYHTHKPTNIEQRSNPFLRPPIFFLRTDVELLPQTTHMQPLHRATQWPHATLIRNRRPICRGSHPTYGPSIMSAGNTPNPARRNRPKGSLLLPFSSSFPPFESRLKWKLSEVELSACFLIILAKLVWSTLRLVENSQPIVQMPKQLKPQLTIQEEMNINRRSISEIKKLCGTLIMRKLSSPVKERL